jgi:hypothetical protein
MQEDYIIRLIKDVAKVLAIALDLFKNDKPDEALALTDQTLQKIFGLEADFSITVVEQLLAEKQLTIADLKQLLSLITLRADFLAAQSNIFAKAEYEKCIAIIELIENNTTIFDASISRYKSDIYDKIETILC